jgi:hypothetical protein
MTAAQLGLLATDDVDAPAMQTCPPPISDADGDSIDGTVPCTH